MEQSIDESHLIKKEGSEMRFDEQTDQVELVGKEEGEKRVLATMNFVPTNKQGFEIVYETAMKMASEHFQNHYQQIGWFPSGEYPDVMVKKREDNTWFAVSFLSQKRGGKDWSEFPAIHHDDRSEEEVLTDTVKQKTITKI